MTARHRVAPGRHRVDSLLVFSPASRAGSVRVPDMPCARFWTFLAMLFLAGVLALFGTIAPPDAALVSSTVGEVRADPAQAFQRSCVFETMERKGR